MLQAFRARCGGEKRVHTVNQGCVHFCVTEIRTGNNDHGIAFRFVQRIADWRWQPQTDWKISLFVFTAQ
jgi:hypothetical protein